MASLLLITSFAVLVMEILVGMGANGFIVLINFIDWFRRRKLSPNDLILICLGLARLAGQMVVILDVTMFSFFPHNCKLNAAFFLIIFMWTFTTNINLWFAVCLSFWYLMKIAIFSQLIYLQVKQRSSQLLPWLLLGSVVFSAFMTIVITEWSSKLDRCGLYKLLLNNGSHSETEIFLSFRHFSIATTAPNFIPSVIFLLLTVFLIISLWKHVRRLQCNGIVVKDLNTQAHLTAIKALASFAVLYLSSFAVSTSQTILFWRGTHPLWTFVLFQTVSSLYPSGHAVILILISPKLRQAWVKMMHRLKCPLCEASF